MKVHAIIQSRNGNTRLPGKEEIILNGKTIRQRVVENAKKIKGISKVIIATTTNPKDDSTVKFCKINKVYCFRGSEKDVLGRFVKVAKKYKTDVIVRLTADNPFLNPTIAQSLLEKHIKNKNDYTLSFGYPLGTSCEIFSVKSLVQVNKITKDILDHEHLGRYFLEHQNDFKVMAVKAPKKLNFPKIRLTVDYPEDLETAQSVLYELGNRYTLPEIIELYGKNKKIFTNRYINQVKPSKGFQKAFSGKNPLLK